MSFDSLLLWTFVNDQKFVTLLVLNCLIVLFACLEHAAWWTFLMLTCNEKSIRNINYYMGNLHGSLGNLFQLAKLATEFNVNTIISERSPQGFGVFSLKLSYPPALPAHAKFLKLIWFLSLVSLYYSIECKINILAENITWTTIWKQWMAKNSTRQNNSILMKLTWYWHINMQPNSSFIL